MSIYIYQNKNWPAFRYNLNHLIPLLGNVRNKQGKLLGKMESLGFDLQSEATLETLTLDTLKSSEIEGELLNPAQVRSSVAQRLGVEITGLIPTPRNVDGVVEMMIDATQNYDKPLTKDRLFDWQAALFPTGRSGMTKIVTGGWRTGDKGPMQVVSGTVGKETVHYEAPDAEIVDREMSQFLDWFNRDGENDAVIQAGIAHLWFVTVHPFEDGNGRIARALTDMLLTRSDEIKQRYYSMSSQISKNRKAYYEILEKTQKGNLDITEWLIWFLECLSRSIDDSDKLLKKVISKHQFWSKCGADIQNERQKFMLNKLLEGFKGKLTTSKWAKTAKCSTDTALRDIKDLIEKDILKKTDSGGRSTSYELTRNS